MQKRVYSDEYPIVYDSFQEVFNHEPIRLLWSYNYPDRDPIEDLHHHDAIEVGYCFSGTGIFIIDGESVPFSAPCATVLYPGQFHKACSTGDVTSRWLFVTFRAEGVFAVERFGNKELPWRCAEPKTCLFTEPSLLYLAEEIAKEIEIQQEGYEDCVRGLLAALLIRHSRLPWREGGSDKQRESALKRLQPLMKYISHNYTEKLTVEQLAEQVYVHPTTLRNWFQEATGLTPMQYVHRTRIAAACSLLQGTEQPIADIAMEVGYPSMSGFNRHFREICDCTPTAYRFP
jgi:AraC-like DNA-binding protein